MALSREEQLAVLEVHRENLEAAKDFESYRAVHVAYVEFLIEQCKIDISQRNNAENFAVSTWRILEKKEEEPAQ
jgi:hypothetical protein